MKNYKVVGIRADGTRIVRNAPNVKVANRYRNWMLTNANCDSLNLIGRKVLRVYWSVQESFDHINEMEHVEAAI